VVFEPQPAGVLEFGAGGDLGPASQQLPPTVTTITDGDSQGDRDPPADPPRRDYALGVVRSTKSCRCRARVPRSMVTPSVAGGQPARRYNPTSLAVVAHPAKRDAETSSPAETIGRPIGEAAVGLDRLVPSTCVNATMRGLSEGCVPTWPATPGRLSAPCTRAAPKGPSLPSAVSDGT
jgi:hypothetical protein